MKKASVQQQFGANAANYVNSPVHAKGASLERLIATIEPKPNWQALDIATGAGHTALAFAPHVAAVIASDLTPEMLDQARQLAETRGLTNVSFKAADATNLPFEDNAFDLVTCRIAPHHFPDIGAFVREVHRVLKPGGVFGLVDNLAADANTSPCFDEAALADARDMHNAFETLRDPSHERALSQGEWFFELAQAGFEIRHHEHLAKRMNLKVWCDTMSVDTETRAQLLNDLRDAAPVLADFLKPQIGSADDASDTTFELTELLVVAVAT